MRKILQLSFYVSIILLLVLFLISFSHLELVYFKHQIMFWKLCFYGFITMSILCLYLMISSNNIDSKMASIPMMTIILLIIGGLVYANKPSRRGKIREEVFYDSHCIKKRTQLIQGYLIWYSETCN